MEPTTCEYPTLMAELPDLTISDVPLTVVQRVYAKGDPLGGNICPPVRGSGLLCVHTSLNCRLGHHFHDWSIRKWHQTGDKGSCLKYST